MSREFGSDERGYFHEQMRTAAEDCLAGGRELTILWGKFFDVFSDIAYEIASVEANDHCESSMILEHIRKFPELKKKFEAIEKYVKLYEIVVLQALKLKENEQKK